MSDLRAVEFASRTLVRLLERRFADALPSTTRVTVQVATPRCFSEFDEIDHPHVTLFLYQIVRSSESSNAPARRSADGQVVRQPLAIELGYLVTAWAPRRAQHLLEDDPPASLEEQRILGLVMQTFYDHAELGVAEFFDTAPASVWRAEDSLQIILESLAVEEQYRIWDAIEMPYRLSLAYRVRVLGIDSAELDRPSPVGTANLEIGRLA